MPQGDWFYNTENQFLRYKRDHLFNVLKITYGNPLGIYF